jgi:hypothetical protein
VVALTINAMKWICLFAMLAGGFQGTVVIDANSKGVAGRWALDA